MVQFRFQIAAVQDGRGYCVNPEGQDQGKRWGASDVPGQVRDYTIIHVDWSFQHLLFFSWTMWITWMYFWRCSLGVRTPASSWTLRSRQGRRLKPRWSDSDIKVIVLWSFISDARWTTARERWRCWRRRLRKMTRGENWVVLTHQFVISTRKLDLKFCSPQNLKVLCSFTARYLVYPCGGHR